MSTNLNGSPEKKKWCVMVYFAADVDLEEAAMADVAEMKAAGSSPDVDLLAQVNRGSFRPIQRYHLQQYTYVKEDLVPQFDDDGSERLLYNVNAKQDLIDFVEWCATQSQAEHYALVLWGHGQGWKADDPNPCFVPGAGNPRRSINETVKNALAGNVPNNSFSFAESMPLAAVADAPLELPIHLVSGETGFLTNEDLKDALAQAKQTFGKNIDILGMDACLMAMAEICCQIDDSVDYLVASEDVVPDESWPYNSILKLLVENADQATPEDLARLVVWKFIFDFGEKRKFVTQSICRVGKEGSAANANFTGAVSRLAAALSSQIKKDPETRWATLIARGQAQSFYLRDYVDLYDFCRLLSVNCNNDWVSKACEDVMIALNGQPGSSNNGNSNGNGNGNGTAPKLVVDYGTYGASLKRSFGVSVFFPCIGPLPSCYRELEFCKRTNWHQFLEAFLTSPDGRMALLEPEPAKSTSTKNGKPLETVLVPSTGKPAALIANANAVTGTAVVAEAVADEGLDVGNNGNIKTTLSDPVKTTYGDVVKTTYGEPIKTPLLPAWVKPGTPRLLTQARPSVTPQAAVTAEPVSRCGCGQKY